MIIAFFTIFTALYSIIEYYLHIIFFKFIGNCSSLLKCFAANKLAEDRFADNRFCKREMYLNSCRRYFQTHIYQERTAHC